MIVRAEKIAAALFAVYFAYFLKSTLLGYATEPKVIGGIDLDREIPQVMFWSPVYYPMLLSAAFAYWVWPKTPHPGLVRRIVAGSFAMVRVIYITLFVSALCTGVGAFYLAFPNLLKAEILPILANIFLSTLGATAIMGIFHLTGFILYGVVFGSTIAIGGYVAESHLQGVSAEPQRAGSYLATIPTVSEWPWPGLLAGLVVVALIAIGFSQGNLAMLVLWFFIFLKHAFPFIAVGAMIGFFNQHWGWCVPASLPIALYFSTEEARPSGFFAALSFDFPPVLFAMLLGFIAMRALAPRFFAHQGASPGSFGG